jgi:hypothetical protein
VSLILGSGIIIFGVNVIYSDFIKQPNVVVGIQPRNSSVAVSFTNTGLDTAHKLLIILSSNASVFGPPIIVGTPGELIHFEKLYDPIRFVANLSRLTSGDEFTIITPFELSEANSTASYSADVTYDEGGTSSSTLIGIDSQEASWFDRAASYLASYVPFDLLAVIIVLASFVYSIPNLISLFRGTFKSITEGNFIRHVENEMRRIGDGLRFERPDSMIPVKAWSNKRYDDSRKRSIFYKYNDYKQISDFYSALEKRNTFFSNENLNDDTLQVYNEYCSDIAMNVRQGVHWQEYESNLRRTKRKILELIILAVIISSISIILPSFV